MRQEIQEMGDQLWELCILLRPSQVGKSYNSSDPSNQTGQLQIKDAMHSFLSKARDGINVKMFTNRTLIMTPLTSDAFNPSVIIDLNSYFV